MEEDPLDNKANKGAEHLAYFIKLAYRSYSNTPALLHVSCVI